MQYFPSYIVIDSEGKVKAILEGGTMEELKKALP